jgi:hypothetical protein
MNKVIVGMQWPLALGLIALLGGACKEKQREQAQPAPVPKAEVEKVTEEPMRFLGKRVTISGEVGQVHNARAFELKGEGIWWDDTMLVLTRAPVSIGQRMLAQGEDVTATGVVNKLSVVDVERDVGWDLQPELEVEFRDKPVLVADTISVSDAQATWSEKQYPQGTMMGLMQLWTAPDPSQLAGQALTVNDVPVRSKTGKALWIGYNDLARVMVVPTDATALDKIEAGQRVTLTGTVEKMPPADQARKQWSLPPDMQAQLAKEPVYIHAARVAPAAPGKMTMNVPR